MRVDADQRGELAAILVDGRASVDTGTWGDLARKPIEPPQDVRNRWTGDVRTGPPTGRPDWCQSNVHSVGWTAQGFTLFGPGAPSPGMSPRGRSRGQPVGGPGAVDRCVLVYHRHAPGADPPAAAVYPDGPVATRTADPALARDIAAAIRDPPTTVSASSRRMVQDPATAHDPFALDRATPVGVGLSRRGLCGVPVDYPRAPPPRDEDPPGLVY